MTAQATHIDTPDIVACRFSAPFTLAPGDDNTLAPFSLLARTPDPIDHWYWGRMIHDFDGMTHKERIPIDWAHDNEEAIGYADRISVTDDGLIVAGELVSTRDGDRAADVIAKARGGIPFEASIQFHLDGLTIEELGPNDEADVNGRTFQGPLTIFRKWKLAAVAIVPFGADPGTEANILARRKTTMTQQTHIDPTPQTPDAAPPSADHDQLAAAQRDQLRTYIDRFGAENGAAWFADGVDYQDALERYVDQLENELAAANDALAELKHQLSAVQLGEDQPLAQAEPKNPGGLAGLINIRR